MQKTSIEWCTHVQNIMTGCLHGCSYCYARQTAENPFYRKAFPYGFEPHFYEERIQQVAKLKTPAIIFMDSMSDTFGSWWTDEQVLKVLHVMDNMRGVHWHKYVVLTKNPIRMVTILEDYAETDKIEHLKNVYFGTSITGLGDEREFNRLGNLRIVHEMGYNTVLSVEPLIFDPISIVHSAVGISWADWIIVGGQTKPTKIPPEEWVLQVANETHPMQPLFVKENCGGKCGNHFHDFPEDLLPIAQAWGKV